MPKQRTTVATRDDTPRELDFGGRLRAARLRAGLTQTALAGDRYTKGYLSALENGLSRPSVAALDFLARRLGLGPADLLGGSPDRWARVEADLRLAAGDWQAALDAYDLLLDGELARDRRATIQLGRAEALARLDRPTECVAAAAEAATTFLDARQDAEAAMARYWQASGLYRLENSDEARSLLRAVLEVTRSGAAVEPDLEVRALIGLAMVDSREGKPARALSYLEEARARVDRLDGRRRAGFLESLAISYRESGDYEAAATLATQAIAWFRQAEDELEVAMLDNELALTLLALGALERARGHAAAAHARMAALGNETRLANVIETEAQVALASDDLDAAGRLATDALAAADATGNRKAGISALMTRGRVARRRGDRPAAVAALEAAVDSARTHGRSAQLRDALVELSEVVAESGDTVRAYQLVREALR
jgi:transcriptional regulator with XRE-family HTH domain